MFIVHPSLKISVEKTHPMFQHPPLHYIGIRISRKPQTCCACPEIIVDHIKLHSMKFPKPRELKNNDYPDLQEDEPTLEGST